MSYTMMQYYEWHTSDDGTHWNYIKDNAQKIKDMGIDAVWFPPPTKADHPSNAGYAVYDVYDLGEFDQKNSVRTKYGTKDELKAAIKACQNVGLVVYIDLVMNHKAGGDEKETIQVIQVDPNDRNKEISEPYDIEAFTKFEFKGRNDKYSTFKWNFNHFSGVDYDARNDETGVFRILGENKDWSNYVDNEHGNYDYLMYSDINYNHPDVANEMIEWGKWITQELNPDGYRLDAIKHIDSQFMKRFIHEVQESSEKDLYFIGEFWNPETTVKEEYLNDLEYEIDLFDVRLHYNFHKASTMREKFDMRRVFEDTLVQYRPQNVVTFVDNHDTQPEQSLESFVEDWFKQIAYALILLRRDGYPCIFLGDYDGIGGPHPNEGFKIAIDPLLYTRKVKAHGDQEDYFDHYNTIGWVRYGIEEIKGSGCAVIINNSQVEGFKKMYVGKERSGEVWHDFTNTREDEVTIDADGYGTFYCNPSKVSVYALPDK